MRIVYFTHSLTGCWNHGNAHFQRGLLRALIQRGHEAVAYEPASAWSLTNLLADHGDEGLEPFHAAYPELSPVRYGADLDLDRALERADLVIVHEWNDAELVRRIGEHRTSGGRYVLLFHDTHHRAVSDPEAIRAFDLDGYDGVLAFGEALAQVYRRWGWGRRAFVWHEAADTTLFRPPQQPAQRDGLVWIGNWGDDERTHELDEFLFSPAAAAGTSLDVYGVRYPEAARALLARRGAAYRGWLPNARAPEVFARHEATIHVPRRAYVRLLPGIPTIRVFEALACGVPLLSAPWPDAEGLFRPDRDFLVARHGAEMTALIRRLRHDPDLRASLARSGLETIRARHTCGHRADELIAIAAALRDRRLESAA